MRAAMRRLRWVAMGLTTTLCLVGTAAAQTENGEWRSYSGDQGSTKYAPLDQINRTNVKNLRIAWRTGGRSAAQRQGPQTSGTE